MHDFLLHLLAKSLLKPLPQGVSQISLGFDGVNPGWAVVFSLVFLAAVFLAYRFSPQPLGWRRRLGLVFLRTLIFASFLALLTRPVLLLTIEEPVRRTLLVLLDASQSMNLKDQRVAAADLKRVALAAGTLDPAKGLQQNLPAPGPADLKNPSRLELLQALAGNARIDLWSRLHEKADLAFYGFGRQLSAIGSLGTSGSDAEGKLGPGEAVSFFQALHAPENATAVGDSLRALLDENRGKSIAGVLLITDGASNSGIPPLQAAQLAARDHVPLYIYGVGITSPLDIIVSEIAGPGLIPLKENAIFTVKVKGLGMAGRKVTLLLKADGIKVDEKEVDFQSEDEQSIQVSYTPQKTGDVTLEASIPPVEGEAIVTNNSVSTHVRVTDDKVGVLVIEQEARWDFEFLFAMLRRDRRLEPKAIVLDGQPDLSKDPDSPYLAQLPADSAGLLPYKIIVLGDVDPQRLGDEKMKLLADWVEHTGGGLIFHAGPKFNPSSYHGTPLEPLFPIELRDDNTPGQPYPAPVQLKLSPSGEISPLLILSDNAQENDAIWNDFPGVNWTAHVDRARPSAQALLVDPTSDRATRDGPMPVIALQNYGSGQCLFIGLQETYRWRSHQGEKYYTQIWGQMIQNLSAQSGDSGSGAVRLKSDRTHYQVGDRIVISGTVLGADLKPLGLPAIDGSFAIQSGPSESGAAPSSPIAPIPLKLVAVADHPDEYRGETLAKVAGTYRFTVPQDSSAAVGFDVKDLNVEQAQTAMDAKLLQEMAAAGGGRFLREEDLNQLPDLISNGADPDPTFQKVDLIFSPWMLALMIALAVAEWALRRASKLK